MIEDPIDLFYLTGIELSAGQLLIAQEGSTLYVDGRYIEEAKSHTHAELGPAKLVGKVEFDSCKTTYQRYLDLQKEGVDLIPIKEPTRPLRVIKSPEEIEKLVAAANLGLEGYYAVLNLLEEGITEKEVALELEVFWRRKGGSAVAFSPIIAFGENSSKPHYHPVDRSLRKNEAVLIDIGVTLDHYHSDMTRVFFFGNPDPKMEEIYEIVKEAQARALALCKPGVTCRELDLAARDYINQKGFGEFFAHGLGHGIGLQVHEPPRIHSKGSDADFKLEAGMVITVEPGIYLPSFGGVRIEDTVIITPNGHRNLTNCPK